MRGENRGKTKRMNSRNKEDQFFLLKRNGKDLNGCRGKTPSLFVILFDLKESVPRVESR